ncbi:winged helix-turn-helix domain-containing protein [Amycolatopsis sp. NPDC004625]|uniref:ArsR/SmtB family transcription factor n=1 Tax=Amycolatopsis sp. NPDC004625 TaxID=3154670 RepID=UPI0033AAF625
MPYLRIHFTEGDLGRTRLAPRVDHMWEIVSAVQLLQHREGALYFDGWRRRVRQEALADPRLRRLLHTLPCIAPHAEYFPDFLTPPGEYDDLGDALDAVVCVPKPQLHAQIALLGEESAPLRAVADGGTSARHGLRDALGGFYRAAVLPHLDVVKAALHADLARRMHTYLHDGIEAMLTGIAPGAVWEAPTLRVPYAIDSDLHLAGRGLRLVPCYFSLMHPVALADRELPPTVAVPIDPATRLLAGERRPGDHLGALVGTTRAAILRLAMEGCSTRELIRRTGVAPATVTHHTAILRDSGMITTHREGTVASHHITPLGLQVLSWNG